MRRPTLARCATVGVAIVALALALPAKADSSMEDNFNGAALDTCRWDEQSYFGSVGQNGTLQLSTPGLATVESARLLTQARLIGDFDIQVDYQRVAGFAAAPVSPPGNFAQLRLSLGLWWDDAQYIQFARMRHAGGDVANVFSNVPGYPSDSLPWFDTATDSGKLRIVRTGTRLRFLHSAGGAFVEVAAMDAPATPVFAYLDTVNVPVARASCAIR